MPPTETPKTPEMLRALANEVERKHSPIASDQYPCIEPEDVRAHADAWQAIEGALLALTPGGSEFVGSPHRCLEFIKDRMATVMKVAVANKTLGVELEAVKAREEAARPTPCIWRPQPHGDETEYWETTCDNAYCFEIDGPTENDYSFCPGCGHPILVAPLVMTGMEEGDVLFDLVAASEPPGEEAK